MKSTPAARRRILRKPLFVVAVVASAVLIVWCATSHTPRSPVGGACQSSGGCQSGICLPDADPAEVDRFIEIAKAYALGQRSNPQLAGQIEELMQKLPRSSATLRPRYPGVCTRSCDRDPDCPPDMFCAEAVRLGLVTGAAQTRMRICMPDHHPAARLMR